MIFVAVGTQLPFDRLIRSVDDWAANAPHRKVVAQIANGTYVPKHLQWERMIGPKAFREYLEKCDLVVAHAGIGTILSALELGKPVIDNYWQTETGWPILAAMPGIEKTEIRYGTPSFPVYGYNLKVFREDGTVCDPDEKGIVGIVPSSRNTLRL